MKFSENQLIASIARESFYDFLREFWTTIIQEEFVSNWHIKYLCDELQIVAERVFKNETKEYDVVVNVPPGSTKSTIVSQMFPAWCWTRMPTSKFICVSYAYAVALKDSLKTRDIVQSEKYQKCFPKITLREDENTKGLFTNLQTGFRLSAGIGGSITGYHGHFQIVDDPLNPEESFSELMLKQVLRWMQTTLPSRKIDPRIVPLILVQQRLHQNDPSGNMLSSDAKIKHICLPAELTKDVSPPELKERYVDGLMDPIRLPRAVLDDAKDILGEYGYASQMLQSPVPLGGGMIKTDCLQMRDDVESKLVRIVRSWDKAGTEGAGAWSVGVKMAIDKRGYFWILDVTRGRWGATKREEMILAVAEEDGDEVEIVLEIEGGSGGKESGESTVKNLAGFNVFVFHPTGDKESRAYPFACQVGANNVYCLKRPWTKDYVEELKFFPNSRFKDQVDASSGAFNRLAKRKVRVGGFKSKTKMLSAGSRR